MKETILKFFTLAALVAVPLCFSLSSCSSDDSDEMTPSPPPPTQQDNVMVTTLAGGYLAGDADGTGGAAQFFFPYGIAIDASGNLYVADTGNNRIRKITPAGEVTTLAGSTYGYADGTGSSAKFWEPTAITIDVEGNLYVADTENNRIRKVTPAGEVTTLAGSTKGYADGTGGEAQFDLPQGIAIDASGNLYVADGYNRNIRKISPVGEVTTLAGSTTGYMGYVDGAGTAAQFGFPEGIAIDTSGNLYVADEGNHCIRKITPEGVVSTLAGNGGYGYVNGTGSAAKFFNPSDITIDASGNLYVADTYNNSIRKVTPLGEVTTLAGSGGYDSRGYADGTGGTAQFFLPYGIAIDNVSGNIYVADTHNNCIRKIEFK